MVVGVIRIWSRLLAAERLNLREGAGAGGLTRTLDHGS
ncbi:hypothetical protein M2322_003936 [Rhodoblastus acidophilus]|nr:hypothetical protein [Rhodoblastus acidophilus]